MSAAPKYVVDCIAAMREERVPLAARLDAIDLAIDNLSRVWGLHGIPQPLPMERREKPPKAAKPTKLHRVDPSDDSGAASRRDLILTTIVRSEVGMTIGELRRALPKIDGKDRSNALYKLKADGAIKRVGNAWVKAA